MGGSSKGGSAQQSLNYYGTLVGAICWGPLDWITAIVYNGDYLWQCSAGVPLDLTASGVVNSSGYVDLTGGILNPTLFTAGGYCRLYIGTPTDQPDPAPTNQRAYRDTAKLVFKNVYFGQDSGTAPNFQIVGGRRPRIDTSIVASADNIVSDRQINPIAALAEIIADERGAGLPLAKFNAASWLASAHWCAQDAAHQAYSFISPLFTAQTALRDIVKELLDPLSGYLRWMPDGTLGCFIYEWGTNPGGLSTIDARHFTKELKKTDADWVDIPTSLVVSFTDRAYEFQENIDLINNERVAQIRQLSDQASLDRKHVTRLPQAHSQGLEYSRRIGLGLGTGTVSVRAPILPAGAAPGSKILIDIDPEPGGAGNAQLARINSLKIDRTDSVDLTLTFDPLLPATAYTPPWVSPAPGAPFPGASVSASLVYRQAIPLPPNYFGWPPSVGFLATRPNSSIIGFNVFFAPASGGPFAEVGSQAGFAARCQLLIAVGTGTGTLRLQLLDGGSGPDAYIAANTPGGNTTAAANDTMLAILVQLDGSNRIAIDGSGLPIMEFCSVESRAAVTSDTHDYTILRGRCSLAARAWAINSLAWIIPKTSLTPWTHLSFPGLQGLPAYFRLASFTAAAVDETIPLPEADVVFPALAAPTGLVAVAPGGELVTLGWNDSENLDDGLDEYIVYRATAGSGGPWTEIGRTRSDGFHDTGEIGGMTVGTEYWYAVTALDLSGDESAKSNIANATPAGVAANLTPPQNAGAVTEADAGHTTVGGDGTVSASLDLSVPAMPVAGSGTLAAAWQNLLFRRTGVSSQWQIGAGNLTNTGTVTVSVDLLTPGVSYDIALVAFTSFGIPSAVVVATGSPFAAPNKSASAPAPASISSRAPTPSDAVPPAYNGLTLCVAAIITFTGVTSDKSLIGYEFYVAPLGSPPTTGQPIIPANVVPATPYGGTVEFPVYQIPTFLSSYGWVRTIDSTGNTSTWTQSPTTLAFSIAYAGDLGAQDAASTALTGVQIGNGGTSEVQVVARAPFDNVVTLAGGAAEESFNINLTGKGFNTKPDGTPGLINVASSTAYKCRYDWDDAGNSSTNAVVKISRYDGTNTVATPVRITGEFFEKV